MELTDNGAIEEYSPDWSPDATRIVFVSNRPIPGGTVTRTRLWIMDADGSELTQFTAPIGAMTSGTTVQDEHPSWCRWTARRSPSPAATRTAAGS